MNYREPLPDGCPPQEADDITAERTVFRLVRTTPVTSQDFHSQRAEKPGRQFPGIAECHARGLSVFADRRDAKERALKLPKFRGYFVCRVALQPVAGRIQQTFQPSHHTWWPLADFEILEHCEVETA